MTATTTTTTAFDAAAKDLTGTVQSVARLRDDFCRVTMAGQPHPLVGEVPAEDAGAMTGVVYRFYGAFGDHDRHGTQFKFDGYLMAGEQTPAGIVNYLSRSGLDIKRSLAQQLVKRYGVDTLRILREGPYVVASEGFFGNESDAIEKAVSVSASLKSIALLERPRAELFSLFGGHGFTTRSVDHCLRTWGQRAPTAVRRDPFTMLVAGIDGVGFARADALYQALGLPLHRLKRQMMAAWYSVLNDGDGNTWENAGTVHKKVLEAIGFEHCRSDRAVRLGLRSRWLRERDGFLAASERARSEETAAHHLARVLRHAPLWPAELPQGDLTEHQFAAIGGVLTSPVFVLAGTPGTGKTFVAAHVLRSLLIKVPADWVAVCAPTGKAAVRITAAMERYSLPLRATTIHSLLRGSPTGGFAHDASQPLTQRIVVVDEVSMCDTDLMAALLAALRRGANLMLVGDPYQLAPVGHGAPLRDMLAADVPNALLTEIKRNAGMIVTACRDIKNGYPFMASQPGFSDDPAENLKLVHVEKPEDQAALLLAVVGKLPEKGIDPVWETQVIVPRNSDTHVSRNVLNPVLQNILNPASPDLPEDRRNEKYRIGDKFICLRNQDCAVVDTAADNDAGDGVPTDRVDSYRKLHGHVVRVANGDQGRVVAASPAKLIVEFHSPTRLVELADKVTTSRDWDLAYAITGHKSQGSEWPLVIVMADGNGWGVGCREWIYTAISRASRRCLVIGEMSVVRKWVGKVSLGKRKTFLAELIREVRDHGQDETCREKLVGAAVAGTEDGVTGEDSELPRDTVPSRLLVQGGGPEAKEPDSQTNGCPLEKIESVAPAPQVNGHATNGAVFDRAAMVLACRSMRAELDRLEAWLTQEVAT